MLYENHHERIPYSPLNLYSPDSNMMYMASGEDIVNAETPLTPGKVSGAGKSRSGLRQ